MILATPLKGILAAEPYIGGATVVSIYDRQRSFFTEIDYDSGSKHLLRESLAAALAGAGEGEPGKAGEAPEAALRAAREEPEGTQGEAGPPGSSEAGSSSDLASSPEAVSEPLETAREEPEGSQRNDPSGSLEASGGLSGPSRGPLEDETGPAEGQGPLEPQDAQEG
jgi:hypothetical protein